VSSRARRRVSRRLKERERKSDIGWKIVNIVVITAYEKRHVIVLEKLGKLFKIKLCTDTLTWFL